MPDSESSWLDALAADAPDAVAAFRGIEAGRFISVRREVRRRAGSGSAARIATELAAIAAALAALVEELPEPAFEESGGEEEWTVAEAIGHDADSRAGLAMAGALAATNRFPVDAPAVVPGIAGERGHGRAALIRRLAASQRIVERAARSIAGHEEEPCPLEHPLVGRLRCGEWLLFAGVHDLMHLEQVHGIAAQFGAGRP
jgi:DinB family protein